MYIYLSKHTPTGKFYVGVSEDHYSMFNSAINSDPESIFKNEKPSKEAYRYSSSRKHDLNCDKQMLYRTVNDTTVSDKFSAIDIKYKDDINYLGIKGLKTSSATTPIVEKPKVTPTIIKENSDTIFKPKKQKDDKEEI